MHCDGIKIIFIILLTVSSCGLLLGQQVDSLGVDSLMVTEQAEFRVDSITGDTSEVTQTPGSDIKAEVKYLAIDSLVFSLDGGTVELYGDAEITYDDIELTASYIRYEMDQNLVIAHGLPDSAGTVIASVARSLTSRVTVKT